MAVARVREKRDTLGVTRGAQVPLHLRVAVLATTEGGHSKSLPGNLVGDHLDCVVFVFGGLLHGLARGEFKVAGGHLRLIVVRLCLEVCATDSRGAAFKVTTRKLGRGPQGGARPRAAAPGSVCEL